MGLNNKLIFNNIIGHQKLKKVLSNTNWEYSGIVYKKRTKALYSNIYNNYNVFDCAIINNGLNFTFVFKRANSRKYKKICNKFPFMFSEVLNFLKHNNNLIIPILLLLTAIKFFFPLITSLIVFGLLMYLPFEYIIHNFLYGKIIRTAGKIRNRELKNSIKHSIEIEDWLKIKSTYLNTV